jgi:hypothetical protein
MELNCMTEAPTDGVEFDYDEFGGETYAESVAALPGKNCTPLAGESKERTRARSVKRRGHHWYYRTF